MLSINERLLRKRRLESSSSAQDMLILHLDVFVLGLRGSWAGQGARMGRQPMAAFA